MIKSVIRKTNKISKTKDTKEKSDLIISHRNKTAPIYNNKNQTISPIFNNKNQLIAIPINFRKLIIKR